MDQAAIKKYIGVIRRACDLLEQQLDAETTEAFQSMLEESPPPKPVVTPQPKTRPPVELHNITQDPDLEFQRRHVEARKKHVKELMGIDCWPPAVPPQAVGPTSEADQINRARAVLDWSLGCSIEGAHFLDYGCGEGYIAAEATERGCAQVTAYDAKKHESWDKKDLQKDGLVLFTNDPADLKPKGYDLIFLYDVLDHCEDPVGVMEHVRSLIAPGGIVYARCHPWTSKHASHLPKVGLNKSHIHLFLTWEELNDLGYEPMYTRTEKDPIEAYHWWFKDFKIVKEKIHTGQLSDFFKNQAFKDLLKNEQEITQDGVDKFLQLMEIEFIDFVIEAPK